ncbi:MAG TPA: hypothetical protein VGM92_14770 [Candidatus Kapabacteria bacterium]
MFIMLALAFCVSCNPFAPAASQSSNSEQFGDPHTINGYFQAFQYAYQFRDTTLYGNLLADNFVFSFHDYDQGVDIQWGRDDEMQHTSGLFQNTEQLSLLWGDVIEAEGSPLDSTVTRAFSLDVTFNEADIEHVDGSAVFHLQRSSLTAPWLAVSWQDESSS